MKILGSLQGKQKEGPRLLSILTVSVQSEKLHFLEQSTKVPKKHLYHLIQSIGLRLEISLIE